MSDLSQLLEEQRKTNALLALLLDAMSVKPSQPAPPRARHDGLTPEEFDFYVRNPQELKKRFGGRSKKKS